MIVILFQTLKLGYTYLPPARNAVCYTFHDNGFMMKYLRNWHQEWGF